MQKGYEAQPPPSNTSVASNSCPLGPTLSAIIIIYYLFTKIISYYFSLLHAFNFIVLLSSYSLFTTDEV